MPDSLWLLALLLPIAVWMGYRIGRNKQSSSSPDSSRYFKGINYLLNEQPDKAIDVFIEQIQVDNDLVETHLALGNLFRRRGEVDRAIRIHQNLIARPKLDAELRNLALRELAQDYLSVGLYDRAESLLQELQKLDKYRVFALQNLIAVYQQLKDWPQAITSALALQRHGDDTLITPLSHFYCELAELEFNNSDNKTAMVYLQKALKVDATSLRANLLLSQHYMQVCAYKKAQKVFILLSANHICFLAEYIADMRQCYLELDQENQYLKVLAQAIEQGQNSHALPEYIKALSSSREAAEIEKILLNQLRTHGTSICLLALLNFYRQHSDELHQVRFQSIIQSISGFQADAENYLCGDCGYASQNLQWQCPSCKLWGTMQPRDKSPINQSERLDAS